MCPNGGIRGLTQPDWRLVQRTVAPSMRFQQEAMKTYHQSASWINAPEWPQGQFYEQHTILRSKRLLEARWLEFPQRNANSDHHWDALLTTCLKNMSYIFLTHMYPFTHFHIVVPPSHSDDPSLLRRANVGPCMNIHFHCISNPGIILFPSCV